MVIVNIAIVGCLHGELDKMYRELENLEEERNLLIDLVICCGDFQSVRDKNDLSSMAVSLKYSKLGDFHKYYEGKATVPYLTVFVGGNHEASNYLWELPYGGWVAKNIYYMGFSNVVDFMGIKIGGLSGIFKFYNYSKGHYEQPPFTESTKRSVYHIRHMDVEKMKMMKAIDIMVSHDWPNGIWKHGDCDALLSKKRHFTQDIRADRFGCLGLMEVLNTVQPKYYFCAHMHVCFSANVSHGEQETEFMALDKPIPGRKYFEIISIESRSDSKCISYVPEWLSITKLYASHHLSNSDGLPKYTFPDKHFVDKVVEEFGSLTISVFNPLTISDSKEDNKEEIYINPQTSKFCDKLHIKNPCFIKALNQLAN